MIFDYFKSVSAKGVECTQEIFLAAIHEESLVPLYNKIAAETDPDKRQALKRQLPAMTYQAHFPDGKRSNASAVMSGLFMIDIDHIEDPYALYSEKVAGRTEELGIVIAHMTPSRKGLRIVAKCRPEFSSIAENQAWLAQQLGVEHDEACKDAARLSYLVHFSYFYFLDQALWELPSPAPEDKTTEYTENNLNHESHKSTRISQSSGQGSGNSEYSVNKTTETTEYTENNLNHESHKSTRISQSSGQVSGNSEYSVVEKEPYLYRGKPLRDIAAQYVEHFGAPVPGERHTTYCKLCTQFKYICDCDEKVLLAELPDFGLPEEERRNLCNYACKKATGSEIPKELKMILGDMGLIETQEVKAAKAAAALAVKVAEEKARLNDDVDDDVDDWEEPDAKSPLAGIKLPPIYSYVCRVMPPHFHIPAILTLDSILGNYASNLVAYNLNGHPVRTAFHNLIIGDQSLGKGEIRYLFEKLTDPLFQQDMQYSDLWNKYQLKLERSSNGKKEDLEKPFMFFRLAPETFSTTSLLQYMDCSHNQLQLMFTTEIDSLYKNGAHALFDDIYRKAFHQEKSSQRFMSARSFNGIVKVILTVLATGTPEQFWKHYGNPENGLVSRLHYHFVRERFIPRYVVKPFTAKEEAYIRSVIEFAQELTNEVDAESGEIVGVKPAKDISEYMEPYVQPCLDFWEKNRLLAIQSNDYARDSFSHREGEMIFRCGMVDWLCYKGKFTKERVQRSIEFRTKFCQRMLENKIEDFGEKVNKSCEYERKPKNNVNLYLMLGDTFNIFELQQKATECGVLTNSRALIYVWKKQGLIKKVGSKLFKKIQ